MSALRAHEVAFVEVPGAGGTKVRHRAAAEGAARRDLRARLDVTA